MRIETKHLTKDAAKMVYDNFTWFDGFYFKCKKLSENRYAVCSYVWCWSYIELTPEDYAC